MGVRGEEGGAEQGRGAGPEEPREEQEAEEEEGRKKEVRFGEH